MDEARGRIDHRTCSRRALGNDDHHDNACPDHHDDNHHDYDQHHDAAADLILRAIAGLPW